MSAPRTNVKKETKRHRAPLIGVGLAVLFGFLMFLFYTSNAFETAPGLEEGENTEVTAPPGSEDTGAVETAPENQNDTPEASPTSD